MKQVSPFSDSRCGPSHVLHAGRPALEAILTKAIESTHESSITAANTAMTNSSNGGAAIAEGESVGVARRRLLVNCSASPSKSWPIRDADAQWNTVSMPIACPQGDVSFSLTATGSVVCQFLYMLVG